MASNPLVELQKLGQSIWYDNIRRSMFAGDLQAKIKNDDLRGVTSNPAIFEKAIAGSTDYNEALKELAAKGKTATEIYEIMAVEDIQKAADILKPIYDRTGGVDGYISFEVSPELAHDTKGTVADAKRLWKWINRPNVMIKIPATPAGLPAIEEVIAEGINVNVTLIFSQDAYLQVADRYLAGLERRAAAGHPIDHVQSVASFFVSRIDSSVDAELEFKLRRAKSKEKQEKLKSLIGKVAIANAKVAYKISNDFYRSPRFKALKKKGAHVQRILWASTGTKNPAYRDTIYVEELIGDNTINTVPPATYTAFRDHGKVKGRTLASKVGDAEKALALLAEVGVDLKTHTDSLLAAAVKAFVDPFSSLMKVIEEKRRNVRRSIVERQSMSLGSYAGAVESTVKKMAKEDWVRRLWRKDGSLWKNDAGHQKIIANSLGWLTVSETMLEQCKELEAFAGRIKDDGFKWVMLLGMGGSSLCPEVFRRTFPKRKGYPELLVLDTTDPQTIREMRKKVKVEKTLFIVSSKSGSTTEPLMFYQYFYDEVKKKSPANPGQNFIAITDPGSILQEIAAKKKFRRVFLNMADIGGRYSALSYFGMVPAAVAGVNVREILERAFRAAQACERTVPVEQNPGARLGAALGALAKKGRDKVTFVTPPPIDSLGLWIEQLIAESTGKEGTGILPVAGEPLGKPENYGNDRVFVYISTTKGGSRSIEAKLSALEAAGHPVIRQVMEDELSLGREFFLWEFATALAGAVIGINSFDQPNVQESKDNTRQLLDVYRKKGALPSLTPLSSGAGWTVSCSAKAQAGLAKSAKAKGGDGLAAALGAHLGRVKKGDYVALTAYLPENQENDKLLEKIRVAIRDGLQVATTVGYGPRFLHSTGQLHKGGGSNGVFLQVTISEANDLAIPGEKFSFGVLKSAQALGDFQSLESRDRRAVNFHIAGPVEKGLGDLLKGVKKAIG